MRRDPKVEARVGVFVAVALITIGAVAFLIGNQRGAFQARQRYNTSFEKVGGLRSGNLVRIGGVNAGEVVDVRLAHDGRVLVEFEVTEDAAALIRGPAPICEKAPCPRASAVRIDAKGMLGDKLLEIRPGDESLPKWPTEKALPADREAGLMGQAGNIAADIRAITAPLAEDEAFANDIKSIAANLASLTQAVNQGDGAIAKLIHDPVAGESLVRSVVGLEGSMKELNATLRAFRSIADEVRRGDGSMHALIYGKDLSAAVASLGGAAEEARLALNQIREGNGGAHALIYEEGGEAFLSSLTQLTTDLSKLSAGLDRGEGTLGALLKDPSLFNDMKRLIGDLERNEILRALVRYSIRRDETRQNAKVKQGQKEDAQ